MGRKKGRRKPASKKKDAPPPKMKKPSKPDDLKFISGVGPKLEGVLNGLGVYKFSQIAKWKTTLQMIAIGFLLAGPAGDLVLPNTTEIGISLLWIAAIITLYTGYDYFRAGLRHIVD